MASVVDICNLALAHLGDSATVASIDPPEGSRQAQMCARFYPMARDALLEMHTWGFATRRSVLAQLANDTAQWQYTYAAPENLVNIISVIDSGASGEYNGVPMPSSSEYGDNFIGQRIQNTYTPQPFECEVDSNGNDVVYTNVPNAEMRYTILVEDASKFSPLFVNALAWHLASMLAGPMLKGDAGAAMAQRCTQMSAGYLSQAIASDAGQRKINLQHNVSWIGAR